MRSGPVIYDQVSAAPHFDYYDREQTSHRGSQTIVQGSTSENLSSSDSVTVTVRHQVWFQDNRSIAARHEQIVKKFGLKGMVISHDDLSLSLSHTHTHTLSLSLSLPVIVRACAHACVLCIGTQGAFMGDYMGNRSKAAPIWQALAGGAGR